MATHSSNLAWEIPWREEPGSYSPWGCRVRHDWATYTHISRCNLVGMQVKLAWFSDSLGKSVCARLLSRVWLFVTPWTVAHQVPLVHGIFQARLLEWVAISYSRASARPRDRTRVSRFSWIAGRFFTHWADREALIIVSTKLCRYDVATGMVLKTDVHYRIENPTQKKKQNAVLDRF